MAKRQKAGEKKKIRLNIVCQRVVEGKSSILNLFGHI